MDDNEQQNITDQASETSMIDRITFGLDEFKKEGFTSLSVNDGLICCGSKNVKLETADRLIIANWEYWISYGCWVFDCNTED